MEGFFSSYYFGHLEDGEWVDITYWKYLKLKFWGYRVRKIKVDLRTNLQKEFEKQTPSIKGYTGNSYNIVYCTWLEFQVEKLKKQIKNYDTSNK